ncbi:MAG: hypothetical protein H6624_09400 [Bdellovibrionaceae bacterium]|nr:hypothetical protein [Bdellovibrionales bacterium]MCB9084550.1 hypothetical protein [Pseudobdellovibrionaceae bacterium]
MMDFREIQQILPHIHRDSAGHEAAWYVTEVLADYIQKNAKPGMKTLETGAGISTVLFAQAETDHTSVVASQGEVDRILNFCEDKGFPTKGLKFLVGMSELVLPQSCPKDLDFVLIDGGHGFPTPFIDWYYSQRMLKVGGTMAVDDTQIWTGATLSRFLDGEPNWRRIDKWPYRAAVYEKAGEGSEFMDWYNQPYVHRRSLTNPKINHYLSEWSSKFVKFKNDYPTHVENLVNQVIPGATKHHPNIKRVLKKFF